MEVSGDNPRPHNVGDSTDRQPTTLNDQTSDQSHDSDDEAIVRNVKKRTEIFAESDSDSEKHKTSLNPIAKGSNSDWSSDEQSIRSIPGKNETQLRSRLKKSRIKSLSSSEDSECETTQPTATEDNNNFRNATNIKQSSRLNNKKINLREKLQGLKRSHNKKYQSLSKPSTENSVIADEHKTSKSNRIENSNPDKRDLDAAEPPQCVPSEYVRSDFDDSSSSNEADEVSSIEKIKQKIKERSTAVKTTLLIDPDTSSDDSSEKHDAPPKYKRKQTKQSSPTRMSAKQAMENMAKIKSESNRMLREKEVSLPYHRSKALTLKDIMSRRKTVLTPEGKALPIKMNDEQLKLYAISLDQRQKEMMELCKSDTENEEASENDENDEASNNKENVLEINEISDIMDTKSVDGDTNKENTTAADNDARFDVIVNSEVKSSEETLDDNLESSIEKRDGDINEKNNIVQECSVTMCPKIDNSKDPNGNITSETDITKTDNLDVADRENKGKERNDSDITSNVAQQNTEPESQLISLHYSENIDKDESQEIAELSEKSELMEEFKQKSPKIYTKKEASLEVKAKDASDDIKNFSDEDINMDDIDRLIENADIIESTQSKAFSSPMLIKDVHALSTQPRLAGAPGMLIDLDGNTAAHPRTSGIELLKQRFTYFARLKTPEEIERAREKQIKPGFQHLRLKQELEEKIAEQKSIEWAKRLEEEKQQHMEMNAVRGDGSEEEDDIDKIEAKLAETEKTNAPDVSDTSESEPEENDMDITDKPRKHNALLEDEAEESDCDNVLENNDENATKTGDLVSDDEGVDKDESDEETSGSDSSDDDDQENEAKPKRGRILKAFEDSDDETATNEMENCTSKLNIIEQEEEKTYCSVLENTAKTAPNSQDDDIQRAQLLKSTSEDIFNTQDLFSSQEKHDGIDTPSKSLKLNSGAPQGSKRFDKLSVICDTQPYDDSKFDDIAGMCSGSFSQNILVVNTQVPKADHDDTQEIGDDVLALCTGNFYDSKFVSQQSGKVQPENPSHEKVPKQDERTTEERYLLNSILLELGDPEFDDPRPSKFFPSGKTNSDYKDAVIDTQQKKRCIIDSDDEAVEPAAEKIPKKCKKKKAKDRALQISDDEEEMSEEEMDDDVMSAEEEGGDDAERLIEYDSEENEVEFPVRETKKKKRKTAEFFEQEAELTSEDEWVGSGDEDEAGLDRMEREDGDSDTFNQHKLQRELGQIHMRDVLDQDKREVRLLQELLLEDGDLGAGSRQRKFRWKNADGEEEIGTLPDDVADTQEEEFESEEQWRKQRHEREVFLRQMMQKDGDENEPLNTSINRTTIIKANLVSKTMSSLLLEVNSAKEKPLTPAVVPEKKSAKDIPSPAKKPFNILQQNYRGSLLSRGKGALARLAAIAAPLAGDSSEDAPKMASLPKGKSNFVFATLSPSTQDQPKVSKRKNDGIVGTPQLMKKLKTDEKLALPKISLLEHIKT